MDPRPFTLHEFLLMVRGRQKNQWDHTAALLAQLWNVTLPIRQFFTDARIPVRRPEDYHPLELAKRAPEKRPTMAQQIAEMAPQYDLPPSIAQRRKEPPHGSQ